MIKLDRTYSDYTELDDPNYPNGKAVDCSTDESYDGTPILKELVNDLHGALEAVVKESAGSISGVSGNPDNINASDFKDAIMDLIETPDEAHAALRGTDAHGATVEATPGQLMTRDENGRAQVANPSADADIANKAWVLSLRQSLFDAAHPVGSTYTQYGKVNDVNGTSRTMSAPATVFNKNGITSTWVELNYAGAFFRGNGGLSKTFNGGKQAEGLPDITGTWSRSYQTSENTTSTNFDDPFVGAFVKAGNERTAKVIGNSASTYKGTDRLGFKASSGETGTNGTIRTATVYGKSDHVTPENYTLRIWLRTA